MIYMPNPIAVSHAYPRWQSLQSDLTRYYEDCVTSKSAKSRFIGRRRKSYCAGVAWKRMYMAGRYKDYKKYKGKKSPKLAPMRRAAEYALANPIARDSDFADYGYGVNENPGGMVGTVVGLGIVAAIGVGIFLYFRSKKSGTQAVTLQPGSMAIHGQFVGAQVALGLPQGTWAWVELAVDGQKRTDVIGSANPATVSLMNKTGVITATWSGWPPASSGKDAQGNPIPSMTGPITNTTTISYGA